MGILFPYNLKTITRGKSRDYTLANRDLPRVIVSLMEIVNLNKLKLQEINFDDHDNMIIKVYRSVDVILFISQLHICRSFMLALTTLNQ